MFKNIFSFFFKGGEKEKFLFQKKRKNYAKKYFFVFV